MTAVPRIIGCNPCGFPSSLLRKGSVLYVTPEERDGSGMRMSNLVVATSVLRLVTLTNTAHSQTSSQQFVAQGLPAPAVLVELFTSEGCSSCPPADRLLRQINGKTASGQLVIGLSEHVTYWNRLGWSDPFSSDIFTDRQNGYGERFHLDSVYTPQLIVNGNTQTVGSNAAAVEQAIAAQRDSPEKIDVRILNAHRIGARLEVTYSVAAPIPKGGLDLVAVIADDADKSDVLRGENGGRTLTHVAVARSLIRLQRLHEPVEAGQATLSLPETPTSGHTSQHIVLFAQQPAWGAVLGVATQPIAP